MVIRCKVPVTADLDDGEYSLQLRHEDLTSDQWPKALIYDRGIKVSQISHSHLLAFMSSTIEFKLTTKTDRDIACRIDSDTLI